MKANPIDLTKVPGPTVGPRAWKTTFDFTLALKQNLNIQLSDTGLDCVQSVFIDNSNNNTAVSFSILGTLQLLVCPPYSQAIFPLIYPSGSQLQASGVSQAPVLVPVQFLNCHADSLIWSVTAPGAVSGTIPVTGNVTVQPKPGAWTVRNGVLAQAGASQLLMPANPQRQRLAIYNPAGVTGQFVNGQSGGNPAPLELAYFDYSNPAAVDGGSSFELLPGSGYDTATGPVSTEAIYWTAATAGHRLIAREM